MLNVLKGKLDFVFFFHIQNQSHYSVKRIVLNDFKILNVCNTE